VGNDDAWHAAGKRAEAVLAAQQQVCSEFPRDIEKEALCLSERALILLHPFEGGVDGDEAEAFAEANGERGSPVELFV
jgi:hypothetical protein